MKLKIALLVAAIAAFMTACANSPDMIYRPYPQILPQHVHKLAVRPFVNKTQQFGLEDKFNLQVVQQFQLDGTYPVVSENEADGVVTGEIWRYILTPIQYDAAQVPTAYKLLILFHVRFLDKKTNSILWDEPAMQGVQIYSDPSLPGGSTELQAQQSIWERVSQDVVMRTVSGFGAASSASSRSIPGGPQASTPTAAVQISTAAH